MRIGDTPGPFALETESHVALVGLLRNAVKQEVPDRVGPERQTRIAIVAGRLEIDGTLAAQIAEDRVMRDLVLPLVQIDARIIGLSVYRQAQ